MHPLLSKLTIAIPVYNDAAFICATLESCANQAGTVIICDNASTDGTSDICAAFAAKHAHVTHIRHNENIGAHENMRGALFNCKTEYFSLVGSHDLLGENYAEPLLSALENDKSLSLVVGTIQHMNETGQPNNCRTDHDWVNTLHNKTPLDRVEAFVAKLRDCFMFYGVFRTADAQKAWFNEPALGFDRVVLVRTAAFGNVAFVPQSIYYARDFNITRNDKEDRERRSTSIGTQTIANNNTTRNKALAQTALDLVQTDKDLSQALRIIDCVNRRFQNRRYFQRQRLLKIIGGIAVAVTIIALATTR